MGPPWLTLMYYNRFNLQELKTAKIHRLSGVPI